MRIFKLKKMGFFKVGLMTIMKINLSYLLPKIYFFSVALLSISNKD